MYMTFPRSLRRSMFAELETVCLDDCIVTRADDSTPAVVQVCALCDCARARNTHTTTYCAISCNFARACLFTEVSAVQAWSCIAGPGLTASEARPLSRLASTTHSNTARSWSAQANGV